MAFDPHEFLSNTAGFAATDEEPQPRAKPGGFDPQEFLAATAPQPSLEGPYRDQHRKVVPPDSIRAEPDDPARTARIERGTKAGIVEAERPSLLREMGRSAADFGTAAAARFDEEAWLGAGAAAKDAAGVDSPEARTERKALNPVGDIVGGTAGLATDFVAGPAKLIYDAVKTASRPVAKHVTSEIGKKVVNKALLPAAETAATGATIGAAKAQMRGEDIPTTLEEAQNYGTGALLMHGALRTGADAGGKVYDKVVGQASKRIGDRAVIDIAKGSGAAGKKVMRSRGDVADTAREFRLGDAAHKGPEALVAATASAKREVGPKIGAALGAVDTAAPDGMPLESATGALRAVQLGYEKLGSTQPQARAVESMIKNIEKAHAKRGTISAVDLRHEITNLQNVAYESLKPGTAAKTKGAMEVALREVLDGHIKAVAKSNPSIAQVAKDLPTLNRQYSVLETIHKAAKARTDKVPSANPQPPTKGIVRRAGSAVTGAIARGADKRLADFALRVRSGAPRAELEELAERLQLPSRVTDGIIRRYSREDGLAASGAH